MITIFFDNNSQLEFEPELKKPGDGDLDYERCDGETLRKYRLKELLSTICEHGYMHETPGEIEYILPQRIRHIKATI